jgi:hemerythrin-like metal-binding protein
MPWDPSFATGFAEIDRQHRILFGLIDQVEAAGARDFDGGVQVVLDLVKYVIEHFAYEEEQMERHGYPGRAAHLLAHESLVSEVSAFRDQLTTGDLDLTRLHRFLDGWIKHHIGGEDVRLGRFLNERQVVA